MLAVCVIDCRAAGVQVGAGVAQQFFFSNQDVAASLNPHKHRRIKPKEHQRPIIKAVNLIDFY